MSMATATQLSKINEFVTSPDFKIPLASFLKNITGGTVSSIEELTSAQANDVLGVLRKFKPRP